MIICLYAGAKVSTDDHILAMIVAPGFTMKTGINELTLTFLTIFIDNISFIPLSAPAVETLLRIGSRIGS